MSENQHRMLAGFGELPPLRRRVVQVAFGAAGVEGEVDLTVIALCDDSSIWSYDLSGGAVGWHRLPAVPGTVEEVPE